MAQTDTKKDEQKENDADLQLNQLMAAGKKKKRRTQLIAAAAAVLLIAVLFVRPIFFGKKKGAGEELIKWPVERRDLEVSISTSGALLPADSYNIIGLVSGDILSADFEEGDYVNKDDLLFRIDSSDVEKNIEQARIMVENADIAYDGVMDGFDGLEPKATVSGKITRLYVEKGDEVQAGMPIADINDIDNMTLRAGFHSADAVKLAPGMAAEVTMALTGEKLMGTVKSVSGADMPGMGGVLLRSVEIAVSNPGGIAAGAQASASVNGIAAAENGTFEAGASGKVVSPVAGTISKVNVSEGDRVSKDQALASISSDSAQRQIKSAELNRRSAQLSLENSEDLLENYAIKAPISGTVVEKNFKTGDKFDMNKAAVMAVIYDMEYLTLPLSVDELYIGDIEVGQKVLLESEAVPGKTFEGYIDRVGINGDMTSGVTTYPVKVIVKEFGELLPGMNVTAQIKIENAENVLTLPVSAVGRGNMVLVEDPESKGSLKDRIPAGYKKVKVETGRFNDEYIEITEGLSEGDLVAVNTSATTIMEQLATSGMMPGPRGQE